jgi:hypothetical protein
LICDTRSTVRRLVQFVRTSELLQKDLWTRPAGVGTASACGQMALHHMVCTG